MMNIPERKDTINYNSMPRNMQLLVKSKKTILLELINTDSDYGLK